MNVITPNARGVSDASSGPPAASQIIIVGAALLLAVLWYQFDVKGSKKG